MRQIRIDKCKYAISPVSGEPLFCDVHVLTDDNGQLLLHENLFLVEIARGNSQMTARGYASDLLSFAAVTAKIGGSLLVNQSFITGYLHGELYQRRGFAHATLQRHVATLKTFFKWLAKKGYLDRGCDFDWSYKHLYSTNPTDKEAVQPHHHSYQSLYIDEKTFHRQLLPGVTANSSFLRMRDQLALRLGYECGARACEVLDIDASDVRKAILVAKENNDGLWATASVAITGKGSRNRDLLLPPTLCEFTWKYLSTCHKHINNGHGRLICTRHGSNIKDRKHASTVFKKACLTAKISRTHRQGYHRLRKSFGTNLCQKCYDSGKDPWVVLPRRLGHKNAKTTLLYVQFDALRNNRSKVLNDLRMQSKKYRAIQ